MPIRHQHGHLNRMTSSSRLNRGRICRGCLAGLCVRRTDHPEPSGSKVLAEEILAPLSVKQDRRIAGLTPISCEDSCFHCPYIWLSMPSPFQTRPFQTLESFTHEFK
jgi:hypothetical protein